MKHHTNHEHIVLLWVTIWLFHVLIWFLPPVIWACIRGGTGMTMEGAFFLPIWPLYYGLTEIVHIVKNDSFLTIVGLYVIYGGVLAGITALGWYTSEGLAFGCRVVFSLVNFALMYGILLKLLSNFV